MSIQPGSGKAGSDKKRQPSDHSANRKAGGRRAALGIPEGRTAKGDRKSFLVPPDVMNGPWRFLLPLLLVVGGVVTLAILVWRLDSSPDAVVTENMAEVAGSGSERLVAPRTLVIPGPPADDLPLFVPEASDPVPSVRDTTPSEPVWKQHAVAVNAAADAPQLAIILDDMGLSRRALRRAAALPGPMTFSFLPYASGLPRSAAHVRQQGHELMVHVPMEPGNPKVDPGPNALLLDLDPTELDRRIAWNLSRFEGFVGINNHMGSRFTSNERAMTVVMNAVRDRGLLYVDSRTTVETVGRRIARRLGVAHRERDVFLDHDRDPDVIRRQLQEAVRQAVSRGVAMAIGHPYPETLAVLAEELPRYIADGLVLVPVSAVVVDPSAAINVADREAATARNRLRLQNELPPPQRE